jgi:GntR family transcriptional repressor for pyruvate dehydrogenase complex
MAAEPLKSGNIVSNSAYRQLRRPNPKKRYMPKQSNRAGKTKVAAGRPVLDDAPRKTLRFVPIKARRAFEEICDQVRNEIAAGALRPGDRLPSERALCEQFSVSRTAVREALKALEVAGLVNIETGVKGGSFIRKGDSDVVALAIRDTLRLNQSSIHNITEVRILLTIDAIRLACKRGTEADFIAIEKDIDRCEQLAAEGNFDRSTYIVEFYNLLAKATHNDVLVMLVNSMSELQRQMLVRISPNPRQDVIRVRRRVLEALRTRDAESGIAEITKFLNALDRYLMA